MEIYENILRTFLETNANAIIELENQKTISEILTVIRDESLDDPQCFKKIEQIIYIFEKRNINTGFRHDF